ncbi:hypothetical protein M408DRAFT_333429 [Serendipita vermifera MAFF 305830]|uniref:Uncharacterized protein n=1 Tax=Serendipita vermifera MAFF 305830 TaxID=933852 RepID=A0A0C3AN52_SERVB|nr:hypothetical protein M408DRAFT_333429 [Serendipita vermifera MAFF 305830]
MTCIPMNHKPSPDKNDETDAGSLLSTHIIVCNSTLCPVLFATSSVPLNLNVFRSQARPQ